MKTKTLLVVAALLVAGMIQAVAQSNPGSSNGVDTETQLSWPDGTVYINQLNEADTLIVTGNVVPGPFTEYTYINWQETAGGNGEGMLIYQGGSGSYTNISNWPGGRWPELGGYLGGPAPVGVTFYGGMAFGSYNSFRSYNNVYYHGDVTFIYNNQPQAMLITGGAPGITGSELYKISGGAAEYYIVYGDVDWGSTVIPSQQIQIGSLGNLDANGTLYAVLPTHTEVPVTPHVSGSKYYYAGVSAQGYQLASECEASVPTNYARTTIGVGEIVSCYMNPSISAKWSVSGGGSVSPASPSYSPSTIFTAPSSRASVTVTATFPNGSQLSKQFTVIEPTGYVRAQIVSTDTASYFGTGNAGAGMTNTIWIGPTTVSFGKVSIMEVGEVSTDATGYFANTNTWPASKLDHSQHGANHWVALGDPNTFSDHASSGTCPTPWSSGSFSWTIPADWKVGGGPTNSMTGWNQLHTIDSSGKVTVQKFGHTVTRTPNDVITTQ